jgi:hypothetical protein
MEGGLGLSSMRLGIVRESHFLEAGLLLGSGDKMPKDDIKEGKSSEIER